MRPEHIAANQLIDIAHTGDRQAYKAKLRELEKQYSPAGYDNIKRQAVMQYRMETRDNRYTGWRADWKQEKRRAVNSG